MKKITIFLIIVFIQCKQDKNTYNIKIKNENLKYNDSIIYFSVLNNTTNNTLFLGNFYNLNHKIYDDISILVTSENGDTISNYQYMFIDKFYDKNSQKNILNENKTKNYMISKYIKNHISKDTFWILRNNYYLNNSVLIKPFNSSIIKTKFNISKNNLHISGIYLKLNENEKYFLQLNYNIDSLKIQKILSIKQIDSLKKNNIHIFYGVLSSNKVPLIID